MGHVESWKYFLNMPTRGFPQKATFAQKGRNLQERAHLQKMSEEVVVFFVGANKVPNNSIAFFYTYYSIV